MWTLTVPSRLPLYKQIVKLIEKKLASGVLAPGERLPAERVLAQHMSVNRSTVVRALDELSERGILVKKRGSGTYVASDKWGVQNYTLVNWQGPTGVSPGKRESAFMRDAAIAKEEAERSGRPFYDLSGDGLSPDLLPGLGGPKWSWEEMVTAEKADETVRRGLVSLRASTRRFLRETRGLAVPLEEILITSGSRQSIFLISQCLLRPGDAVGVEEPSYCYSLPVFQAAGLRLFPLHMDSGGIRLDSLENVSRRHALKMIFLNPVFHNPTGSVMKDARKAAVLSLCADMRIPIVEDDAYGLLSFGGARNVSPIKAHDRQNQVIHMGSLSSYAGRSLRVGWLVAPPSVVAKLADVRLMMDAGLSVLPQILAAEYMDRVAAAHLPVVCAALSERSARLAARLRSLLGDRIAVQAPMGGLFTHASCVGKGDAAYVSLQRELLAQGILPALGEAFGETSGTFRFNHGCYTG